MPMNSTVFRFPVTAMLFPWRRAHSDLSWHTPNIQMQSHHGALIYPFRLDPRLLHIAHIGHNPNRHECLFRPNLRTRAPRFHIGFRTCYIVYTCRTRAWVLHPNSSHASFLAHGGHHTRNSVPDRSQGCVPGHTCHTQVHTRNQSRRNSVLQA